MALLLADPGPRPIPATLHPIGNLDVESGLFAPPLDGFVADANQEFARRFHSAALDLRIVAPIVPGPTGPFLWVLALSLAASARVAARRRGATI